MPTKDFLAYISRMKNNDAESNIPEIDRYTYYKTALPKRIHKIHSNLKKAFKKDEEKGDPDE